MPIRHLPKDPVNNRTPHHAQTIAMILPFAVAQQAESWKPPATQSLGSA